MKKLLILIPFLYILTLFQTSFLIHFNIFLGGGFFGWISNLVLIAVILITVFSVRGGPASGKEDLNKNIGIFSGICGGFFLDIFSENFIGFHILILVIIAFFIKLILRKYVRFPFTRPV
jgi:hypothetical protein